MDIPACCRRIALLGLVLMLGPAMLFPTFGQEPRTRGIGVRQHALTEPVSMRPSDGNAGLFVGVNQFGRQSGLTTLQFAVHDAIELAFTFVVQLKLIPPKNCWLLIEGQPSAPQVQQHLEQLKSLGVQVQTTAEVRDSGSFFCSRSMCTAGIRSAGLLFQFARFSAASRLLHHAGGRQS